MVLDKITYFHSDFYAISSSSLAEIQGENKGKLFLQVAGAYSKAKGAEVNVSSCCKQIFQPFFSLLMQGNSLNFPDHTVYLPC